MITLRQYQQELIDSINDAWGRVRSVLAVLSTGGGKTVIFSSIIHDHVGASAVVVHRKEIVAQISLSLAKMGVKHRLIASADTIMRVRRRHLKVLGKSFVDPQAQCGVISVQTLTSKKMLRDVATMRWVNQITLCVFDEGHHYVKHGQWATAVELMVNAKLLFVTATPERADGKGLGDTGFCEEMVEGRQTQWLIDNGYLSRFKYFCPESDLDIEGLALGKNGDVSSAALRSRVVDSSLVGDCVRHYTRICPGVRAIGFATDVQTSKDTAQAFRAAGYRSESLDGSTDPGRRDSVLADFEAGKIDVLWNVDLFDEGFDVPAAACAILARPTFSLAKFLQMCGRVLRTAEGKEFAYIIDPVRNQERHLTPNIHRKWSLHDRAQSSTGVSDTVVQKVCSGCSQPYDAFHLLCPYCGEVPEYAERKVPEKVDGDLFELDVDAMAALQERIRKADCDDAEFQADRIKDNVPPVGRSQLLKRHQRSVYRRAVLKELIGWWVGMQPEGRHIKETHRRFFHRFKIDIGTAFTLEADATDELIEIIAERFDKDIV